MREYGKIAPQFWIGDTGKALRGCLEAQVVASYLISSPHANMLGLFYLPLAYLVHETGMDLEGASKGLRRCIEGGFCAYDDASEFVWVFSMATHQVGEALAPNDKRCKGVQNEYDKLPENPFLGAFFDRYASVFNMVKRRHGKCEKGSPFEAPSKPLRSQEQEQEKEIILPLTPSDPVQAPLPDLDLQPTPQPARKASRRTKHAEQTIRTELAPIFEQGWSAWPSMDPRGEAAHKGSRADAERNFQAIVDLGVCTARELRAAMVLYARADEFRESDPDLYRDILRAWSHRESAVMHVSSFLGAQKRTYAEFIPLARRVLVELAQPESGQTREQSA